MPVTAEVSERKSLNGISSFLKITKTVGYYSGQYYCVAENEVGKVISQTANLHVQGYNTYFTLCCVLIVICIATTLSMVVLNGRDRQGNVWLL